MQQIYNANKISQSRIPDQSSYFLNTPEMLSFLNEGDIINVQVIDANSSNVFLALSDGTTFKASLTGGAKLIKGRYLNLNVKNISNTCIEMQILDDTNNFKGNYVSIKDTVHKAYKELSLASNNMGMIMNTVDDVLEDTRFLNDLNIEPIYIQIPLKFNNYVTEAEIYILKRNRSKKGRNTQDITMLISLDTEKMGRVVTLLNKQSINIRLEIRTENHEALNFIKKNSSLLFNTLIKKGYSIVDIKYIIRNEKINIFNFENILGNFLKSSNIKIDLRI